MNVATTEQYTVMWWKWKKNDRYSTKLFALKCVTKQLSMKYVKKSRCFEVLSQCRVEELVWPW